MDYLRLLRELVRERETWIRKRDEVERGLSRLNELIRSTIRMLPDEQRLQCGYDELLERIDNSPRGLTFRIRGAFTAGKEWLTPVEIRDHLKSTGYNFENYRANPLASIHTTLRRMVPHEAEYKTVNGQKLYRLKTASQWMASFAEARGWINEIAVDQPGKRVAFSVMPGAFFPMRAHDPGDTRDARNRKAKKSSKQNKAGRQG